MQSSDEVVAHPGTQPLNIIREPSDDQIMLVALPNFLDGACLRLLHCGPEPGEDNDDIPGD